MLFSLSHVVINYKVKLGQRQKVPQTSPHLCQYIKITPWFRCSGGWPGWRSARSRGRGWTGPAVSPGTRCALRPQPPPPPPPPSRHRPPARPGSRSPPRSDPGRRCAGRRDPPSGSSSPCAAGGAPAAQCSSWAGRGRSAAGFGPLSTPAGSPPG